MSPGIMGARGGDADFVEFEDIETGDTLKRSVGSDLTSPNWAIFEQWMTDVSLEINCSTWKR
jgi:hypothetical protein